MKLLKSLSALAMLALSSSAFAAPFITGSISFFGTTSVTLTGGSGDIASATGVTFNGGGSDAVVGTGALGQYSSVTPFTTPVDFNNFTFAPLVSGTQLWSFVFGGNTYSFDMLTASVSRTPATGTPPSGNISLTGTGEAKITGFANTSGTWSLSISQTDTLFTFSSTAGAVGRQVPAPAVLALLGLGLIGVGVARRFKAAA